MTIQEIQSLEQQLLEAQQNSHVDTLDKLIHEQLIFILPGGEPAGKQNDLEAHRNGVIKITSSASRDQHIEIVGDTAVVSVTVDLKGMYMNQPMDGAYRYLRVWKKMDDAVRIIGGSCTRLT